ncbi:MAG: type IV pilus biogenesis/stability protein PilW [Pseudomonadales bacterium]|nr:type IV pilus biogenesis/stability protein PilW [Pseudomonadales bacterium]
MLSLRIFLLALLPLFLVSCVTTEETLFPKSASKEKEVEARVQIAVLYLQEGKPDMALVHLKDALDVDPKSARVNEVTALCLEKTGEYDRANKHFKKMLKEKPEYTRGRSNYASYLMRRGDYETAYKEFKIVVDDIYFKGRAIAFKQLGYSAAKIGKHDEVEPAYERAVALDSSLYTAKIELAEIKFDNKEYAQAQEYLDGYRKQVRPASAKALLLGIKLARIYEDRNDEASFALVLKNLYPRSAEYLEYIKKIRDNKT